MSEQVSEATVYPPSRSLRLRFRSWCIRYSPKRVLAIWLAKYVQTGRKIYMREQVMCPPDRFYEPGRAPSFESKLFAATNIVALGADGATVSDRLRLMHPRREFTWFEAQFEAVKFLSAVHLAQPGALPPHVKSRILRDQVERLFSE